ncbi:cathepsin G-like [Colias croceus]|uniref:cathepsin G-like n=1 Tax=Colias crocea TaxID=72248 RepID=UPI001E27F671|nr:cathepsin G-like [Colias croceus]
MEGRVIGGEYSTIQNFPHAVFLLIQSQDAIFICGSSVLNQMVLISAAHCFEILNKKSIVRAYGGHQDVEKKILISRYRYTRSIANDIALVKLKHELPLGSFIKRVIVRPTTPSQDGVLAGWGAVDPDMKEFTYKLKAVQQKIQTRDACSRIGMLHPGMICAGSFKRNDSRPAKGDSGSGLVTNDYQLVGLVSHVVNAYPALIVYTNVSYYYKWIQEKSEKICCPS